MRINYTWDSTYTKDQVGIRLNPDNQELIPGLEQWAAQTVTLAVTDSLTSRHSQLPYHDVVCIRALDQMSRVFAVDGRTYDTVGRLKALNHLRAYGLWRINNTTILNCRLITSFGTEKYARLTVTTTTGATFMVSRHYAKQILEVLK